MKHDQEAARLQQVYAAYRSDDERQANWSSTQPGNRAILDERARRLKGLLQKHGYFPLSNHQILDLGCGDGTVLQGLRHWEARPENLFGIDLLPDRVEAAKRKYPELDIRLGNAEVLPYETAQFDLLLVSTVFTSILDDAMAHNVAREAWRVVKPGGAVIWYDFRYDNPRNPHVKGRQKKYIQSLFPEAEIHLQTLTLLPPLARRLGRLTPYLYPILSFVPLLRTHYVGLLKKNQ